MKIKYRIYYNEPDKEDILKEHCRVHSEAIENFHRSLKTNYTYEPDTDYNFSFMSSSLFAKKRKLVLRVDKPFWDAPIPPLVPKPIQCAYVDKNTLEEKNFWVIKLEKPCLN